MLETKSWPLVIQCVFVGNQKLINASLIYCFPVKTSVIVYNCSSMGFCVPFKRMITIITLIIYLDPCHNCILDTGQGLQLDMDGLYNEKHAFGKVK